jgi:LytS/YehU family sensor histidine kinase
MKNAVKYILDNSREGGFLTIRAQEDNDVLVLTICCDCNGVTARQTGRVLMMEERRKGSSLVRADQSLKTVFGQNCGIITRNREDGLPGMEMQVRLPLSGDEPDR